MKWIEGWLVDIQMSRENITYAWRKLVMNNSVYDGLREKFPINIFNKRNYTEGEVDIRRWRWRSYLGQV